MPQKFIIPPSRGIADESFSANAAPILEGLQPGDCIYTAPHDMRTVQELLRITGKTGVTIQPLEAHPDKIIQTIRDGEVDLGVLEP